MNIDSEILSLLPYFIVATICGVSIWCISAIGVLVGLGSIWTPIILTIGLLIVSLIFEKFEAYIKKIKLPNNG